MEEAELHGRPPVPLIEPPIHDSRPSAQLLDLVVEAELHRVLGEALTKHEVLAALAAGVELAGRVSRGRWLTIEQARVAGASWAEVDRALGLPEGGARASYERALERQRRLSVVAPDRCDPGPPDPQAATVAVLARARGSEGPHRSKPPAPPSRRAARRGPER